MKDDLIKEQIAYYRARAQEYDSSLIGATADPSPAPTHADLFDPDLARIADLLSQQGPFDRTLELACGTGIWTGMLLSLSNHVTALDAAPEMLAIARQKHGDDRIAYQQADLFQWEPDRQYDLVFFAFWLSHILPEALDPFLSKVARAVKPGGQLIIVDQYAPLSGDRAVARDDHYAERPLADGRTFTIVKVFYDLDTLSRKLSDLNFNVDAQPVGDSFFFLNAQHQAAPVNPLQYMDIEQELEAIAAELRATLPDLAASQPDLIPKMAATTLADKRSRAGLPDAVPCPVCGGILVVTRLELEDGKGATWIACENGCTTESANYGL
jgi:demethylmenaquinone methyltransferase/2-methoxy-6-polyprenyl-1,4-benzoquinol methylase